jgi:O-antigen ligase/polysaccharide polymerase Wzy-like membrane protein
VIIGALALNLPGKASDQYERFTKGTPVQSTGDLRQRLTDPGNNGRLAQWDVALEAFGGSPLHGRGAGTYELLWDQDRPRAWRGVEVADAHSLYVEVLGELGIVGFVLVGTALGTIVLAFAVGARWLDRSLFGVFVAAAITWLIHAGVDWDWETPAVSVWLFAAGGAVLAAREPSAARAPSFPVRALIVVGCAALAAPAGLVAATQLEIVDGNRALNRGDCTAAIADADSAQSQISFRPEPHQLLGYCYARQGLSESSVAAMSDAVRHDPHNWEYEYGLAIVRGAAGLDPRPAAAAALRLNPFEPLTRSAAARFRTDDPGRWKRQARRLLSGVSL